MKLHFLILLFAWLSYGGVSAQNFELGAPIIDFAFSPDNLYIAVLVKADSIYVWDIETGAEQWKIQVDSSVSFIQFSADGSVLLSVRQSGLIIIRDAQTGVLQSIWRPLLLPTFWIYRSVALSPDRQWLAIGGGNDRLKTGVSSNGLLSLHNLQTGEYKISHPYSAISDLTFSPDSQTLALSLVMDTCGRGGGGTALMDVESGNVRYFSRHGGTVGSVVLSADQQLIAGSGTTERCLGDPVVWVWDTQTAELQAELLHYTFPLAYHDSILAAAYCPKSDADDRCDVQEIRLWDVDQQQDIATFSTDLSGHLTALAFSPDGNWLASGTENGDVTFWKMP